MPNRWAAINRIAVSFFKAAVWCFGSRTPCCSERAYRAWFEGPWCCVWFPSALSQGKCIRRPVVLSVIPVGVVPPSAVARIVAAHLLHASPRQSRGAAAQHAAVADRFAREIVGFWAAVPSARGG